MDKIRAIAERFFEATEKLGRKREFIRELELLFGKYLQSEYILLIPTEHNINLATSFQTAYPDQEVSIPNFDPKKRIRPTILQMIKSASELNRDIPAKADYLVNKLTDETIILNRNEHIIEYLDIIKMTNKLLNSKTNAPKQVNFSSQNEKRLDKIGHYLISNKRFEDLINIRNISIDNINGVYAVVTMYSYRHFKNQDFLNWNRIQINSFINGYKNKVYDIINNKILLSKNASISFEQIFALVPKEQKVSLNERTFYSAFNVNILDTENEENTKLKIKVYDLKFNDLFNLIIDAI